MHRQRVILRLALRLLSVLATSTLLLTLASCSFGSTTRPQHLVIATLFATSGTFATSQLPAQYGVDLAVSQAHLPDGYTVSVVHEDYGDASYGPGVKSDSAITTEVHALVNDSHVVGVVGPFNSSVATLAMPITNVAGLSLISPTNTNSSLTLESYATASSLNWSMLHPPGHPNRYFRLPANDVEQGQLDAYFSAHVLGAKTAFVVYDNSIDGTGGRYGADLASYFTSAFTSVAGHTIVSAAAQTHGNMIDDFNIQELVAAIVARNPDLVYYGGCTAGGGGLLKRYLDAAGYTKPLLGGDCIANDPYWLTPAPTGAGDTYGSVPSPDVSTLTSKRAQRFVSAYQKYVADRPDNTLSPWSVMAYDAANALIKAVTMAIEQGDGRPLSLLRTQTGADLASPGFTYAGITGEITFDDNGDNAGQRIFSAYEVSGSAGGSYNWSLFGLFQCNGSASLRCQQIAHL